eukprot:GHVT01091618.1.p1 GENE.GHVT01091618.1~~GHVT01091618.1.p1  ORF type:complete len:119 (-),score=6.85 GHVT01091618.1:174-530(-)
MLETVKHLYQHKTDNRTTIGARIKEAKGVTTAEEVITVGMMIERKTVTEIMVNGMIQAGTTDVDEVMDEAMDEVETVGEDQGEVTRMDGSLHRKPREQKTGNRKGSKMSLPRPHSCWW